MSSCANCGTTILFGGKKHGTLVFCSDACYQNGVLQKQAASEAAAEEEAEKEP